ncbi:MAG: ABC transporter ATP-binding protein [Candidatus Hydrogenedentota bacterium]
MFIKINNITFYYDSFKALDNITFQVDSGQFFTIVGPNGSGKTTLLKCINNTLKPYTGAVYLDKEDISIIGEKAIARKIGVVPQNSSSQFPFTIFDTVLIGRYPHLGTFESESKKDYEVVRHSLDLCDIRHLETRLITELSGGEFQRMVIARALAQEPSVLLLDEPTLHLDINYQIELMELLVKLCKNNGLIIVMVSHDLNLAARYSDRVIILKSGRIFVCGTAEQVFNEQNIFDVYGVNVEILRDKTGCLNIIPLCVKTL